MERTLKGSLTDTQTRRRVEKKGYITETVISISMIASGERDVKHVTAKSRDLEDQEKDDCLTVTLNGMRGVTT
jgi:hypothetical protein